jgi:Asp-tRNA(Asn)/Glu-tRNA(Gln) amidotransferase A subunit family amidase
MSNIYDLTPLAAPRTAGTALRISTALVESSFPGRLIATKLLNDVGVGRFRDAACDEALSAVHPILSAGPQIQSGEACAAPDPSLARGGPFVTSADFVNAYTSGETTPSLVALRLLDAIAKSDEKCPPLRAVIASDRDQVLANAAASTARYAEGRSLGPLDGVPIGVKDELDQAGYGTTVGTRFMGKTPAKEDATVVGRLRRAGAMLLGKLNMHEIGIGVTGINPHHGAARNPYNRAHATGGSSSGSGTAVGSGLCPISVGADGGGSIRIPASLCGIVGLKATFGRISEHGAAPLCWSVAHVGPLGASVYDTALGYAVMAGHDPRDPNTAYQPPCELGALENPSVDGLRIGIYDPYFSDAHESIVNACERAVESLCRRGATRHDITLPGLDLLRTTHMVTIVSEMLSSMMPQLNKDRRVFGHDVRLNLALARRITNADYVKAQRLRSRFYRDFSRVFENVDVIVTPTTACTAPVIKDDALKTGDSNLPLLDQIMRFSPAANLTGLPGLSVPVGYDAAGLPIGLQIMGPAWSESRLLSVGAVVEEEVERIAPPDYARLF